MPTVNSSDRIRLSNDQYLRLLGAYEENKLLRKTLEHASETLHDVYELLIGHGGFRGHSKQIQRIAIDISAVDSVLRGERGG
jgi:hypothetical protein